MNGGILEIILLAMQRTDERLALHCKRVSCIAPEVAAILGYGETFQQHIKLAGLLHDIGFIKLNIDLSQTSITNSHGDKLLLMQQHPKLGQQLLADLALDPLILDAISHHHEHYDGCGYPDGLAGDEIPVSARIIAACEYYDSLLAGEHTGDARGRPKDVRKQIIQAKWNILDPNIVEALLSLIDKHPIMYQTPTDLKLGLYSLCYLQPGTLEDGALINQDGVTIVSKGQEIDEAMMEKIHMLYPGQKFLVPAQAELAEAEL